MAKILIHRFGVNLITKTYGRALIACAVVLASQAAQSRGVSPYLPLNLSPAVERQIERVLLLADKPVMRRPIPAAAVFDALPQACKKDRQLCEEVRAYLRRYMRSYGLVNANVKAAATAGDSTMPMPNSHGRSVLSSWQANAAAYYQPSDYILVNAGGVAYEGDIKPTGSFLSLGFDYAQLDVGYRDHWFSPLSDSSSLISTQAPTMPSVTLSNYAPITPLGFGYEIFAAQMSRQENIFHADGPTSGNPLLAGIQVMIEPTSGYAFAIQRETQYGGGARGKSGIKDFYEALFTHGNSAGLSPTEEFGNQIAGITSSMLIPAKVPFGVHLEYAGEDNAYAPGYRMGAINFSMGIDLPVLWKDFDASFEVSEWQNSWYTHSIYPRGITNDDHVIGHWFGDQRVFGDSIGGSSQSVRVGWRRVPGEYWRASYKTMALDIAWSRGRLTSPYSRAHEIGLSVASSWRNFPIDLGLKGGRDVLGDSFVRLEASVNFVASSFLPGTISDDDIETYKNDGVELFVDMGANRSSVDKFLVIGESRPPIETTQGMHLGVGGRREVSTRGSLGVRLELDEVEGNKLISLRALDYQYRVTSLIAANGFFGFGRYDTGLPADGYYWGGGLQFRNLIPKWDIALDYRHYEKLNRDKALPTDPPPTAEGHPRLYYDIDSVSLYVTRRW
jgi:hypothetical protein